MKKASATVIERYNPAVVFWMVMTILVTGVFLYFVLVNVAVVSAVDREELRSELAEARTSLGEIEFAYVSRQSRIDRDDARALGFVAVAEPDYVEVGRAPSLTYQGVETAAE